jgi:hypothetical protein
MRNWLKSMVMPRAAFHEQTKLKPDQLIITT